LLSGARQKTRSYENYYLLEKGRPKGVGGVVVWCGVGGVGGVGWCGVVWCGWCGVVWGGVGVGVVGKKNITECGDIFFDFILI